MNRFVDRLRGAWFALRCPTRTGYDPFPALAGGEYRLSIGTRGFRYGCEYRLSRDDMEMLAEAISDLLDGTEPCERGYRWVDRTEQQPREHQQPQEEC